MNEDAGDRAQPESERRRRVDELLDAALALPAERRARFLEEARCEPEVRAEVERLLAEASSEDGFLATAGAASPSLLRAVAGSGPAGPAATWAPGVSMGPYRLVERLGEGGMGEVWLAEQREPLERTVALKLVREGMGSREVLARFDSERQALARMNHPNIAQVYDAGTTPAGPPYFVMEHVAGARITDYCDAERLSVRQRLRLFLPVCAGVEHAHQKGLIHRDLKPSNVLVDTGARTAVPKIIDFGVARAVQGRLSDHTAQTSLGQLVGTPQYMSPEQADLVGADVDTRSDIYSLGVLLYELLAGLRPFDAPAEGAGLVEFLRRIREEDPPRPSQRVAALGEGATGIAERRGVHAAELARLLRGDLDWIVLKAMEKDRARRYATATELAADIERHLHDEPVLAGPPSAAYRAAKFVRRHRVSLAAATVAGVALVGGLAGTTAGFVKARREAERARSQAAIAEAVNDFLNDDLLAAVRPEREGIDVTMRRVLDAASQRIEGRFPDQPLVEASLRMTIGSTYGKLGAYDAARPHLERAWDLLRSASGEDDPATLAALFERGSNEFSQYRLPEAEASLRQAAEGRRRVLGENDRETFRARLMHGSVLARMGRYDDSDALFKDVHERCLQAFGPRDELTLHAVNNLAANLQGRGEQEAALPLLQEAAAGYRETLGVDHPRTIAIGGNICRSYLTLSRWSEAEACFRELIPRASRILGEGHDATIKARINLSDVLVAQNRRREAEPLVRETLAGVRKNLGPESQLALVLEWTLARLLDETGRAKEGLSRLDAAAAVVEARYPGSDDFLAEVHTARAACLLSLGRRDAARAALDAARGHLHTAYGDDPGKTNRGRRADEMIRTLAERLGQKTPALAASAGAASAQQPPQPR